MAFSPDGQRVASASRDKTVKLWNASSGKQLGTLTGHSDAVYGVAFSPDGQRVASASADKTILIEPASDLELLRVCRRAVAARQLTPEECERYFRTRACPALPDVP